MRGFNYFAGAAVAMVFPATTPTAIVNNAQHSALMMGVQPTSQCWMSAVSFLRAKQEITLQSDGQSDLCKAMTEGQQKLLALEIANCHMDDLGKPLFKVEGECHERYNERRAEGDNGQTPAVAREQRWDPLSCLKELSNEGTSAYTHYVSHVQILCIRLTQDYWIEYQQAAQNDLAQKHLDLGKESIERWEDLQVWAKTHHAQLQELTTTVPQQVQEQLVETLSHHISEVTQQHFVDHVKQMQGLISDQMANVMNSQLANHKSALNEVLMELTEEQRNHHVEMIELAKKQKEAWNERVAYWQTNIQRVVDQQTESVHAILQKVNSLQDRWQNTAVDICSAIVSWSLRNIVILFSVFSYFVGQLFTWVILTRPKICRKARKKVLLISVISAMMLLYMKLYSQGEISTGLIFDIAWDEGIDQLDISFNEADLRRVAFVSQLLIYGCTILNLFFNNKESHDNLEDDYDVPMPEPFENRFAIQADERPEESFRSEGEDEFHNEANVTTELHDPAFPPRIANTMNSTMTRKSQIFDRQRGSNDLDQASYHPERLLRGPVYPTPMADHLLHSASPIQSIEPTKEYEQTTSTPQQQADVPTMVATPVIPEAKMPPTETADGMQNGIQVNQKSINRNMHSEGSESEDDGSEQKNGEEDDMSTTSSDPDDDDIEEEALENKKRPSRPHPHTSEQNKRQRIEHFHDAIQFDE